jgi:hypothetical protein
MPESSEGQVDGYGLKAKALGIRSCRARI